MALEVADIRTPDDLNGAFDTMVAKQVGALLIVIGPLTYLLRQPIAELALKHQLPTITNASQFAQAGLLMSYGPNLVDVYRRAATYVDKILRGAAPAELPVEQPIKFELVVNPQSREVARPDRSRGATRDRGRGDRIGPNFAQRRRSQFDPKRTCDRRPDLPVDLADFGAFKCQIIHQPFLVE